MKTRPTWTICLGCFLAMAADAPLRGAETLTALTITYHQIKVYRLSGIEPTVAGVAFVPKLDPSQKGRDRAVVGLSRAFPGILYVLDRAEGTQKFPSFGTSQWGFA